MEINGWLRPCRPNCMQRLMGTFYDFFLLRRIHSHVNLQEESSIADIQNIIIWNNSRILIGGKPIFYKPLFQTQIISIKHLLDENNTFLSFDELKQKASINIPFTLYYGLITSIPPEWKKLLRNQNNCSPTAIPTLAPLHDPPSTRTAYSFLLNKAISPPTSEKRILNFGFTKENIHKVYTFPFLITKDSKLIAFQCNIIHHILPTKSSLFRAGITESDTCTLCKTEKQTTSHLLFLNMLFTVLNASKRLLLVFPLCFTFS